MDIVIGPTERSTALTLSVDEAAALSGLGRHTVRDAVAAGSLPVIRVGRVIRISRIALEQWLANVAEQGVDLADYRAARRSCWRSNRNVIQGQRS
jgi:excisionase family DNA binding protein